MNLREQFKKETGTSFTVAELNDVEHGNPEYIRWLEQRLKQCAQEAVLLERERIRRFQS